MINPELKPGDRVVVLHMEDEFSAVPIGTAGTVKSHSKVFGDDQYNVNWDNGSSLALISSVDIWDTEESMIAKRTIKKKVVEGEYEKNLNLLKNIDVFKNFNMKFLQKYLLAVRESSIVNMFDAADYLWLGRERIEHEFKYKDIHNEDAFEKVLEMADQAKSEMIIGVMNVLENEGKEDSLENVNRNIKRYAFKVLQNYMMLF
jgi:hypothetical protein